MLFAKQRLGFALACQVLHINSWLNKKRLEKDSYFEKEIMTKILRMAAQWDKYY